MDEPTSNKDYNRQILQEYADKNTIYFNEYIVKHPLPDSDSSYGRMSISNEAYCLIFCYKYPLEDQLHNTTFILEKTIKPAIFYHELPKYHQALFDIRDGKIKKGVKDENRNKKL